jgi:hypothetical protein
MSVGQAIRKSVAWRLPRFKRRIGARLKPALYLCRQWKALLTGHFNAGYCIICEKRTLFIEEASWLRENYKCLHCRSIPRWRAVIQVLHTMFPDWRRKRIYESSPGGAASDKLRRECAHYVPAHFYPEIEPGAFKKGIRCENLESLTFSDASFDLVVTQDVLEHVLDPVRAFGEIARVLVPGGSHVFTIPYNPDKPSSTRAVKRDEAIEHLQEPIYHGNPIDNRGSLVVTDWGNDLGEFILRHAGMQTIQHHFKDRYLGLDGELLVFLSRKLP